MVSPGGNSSAHFARRTTGLLQPAPRRGAAVLPATLSAAAYAAAQQARAVEAVKKKARRLGLVVTEGVAQAAATPSS